MKGIILAGGSGTRLRPLTNIVNKHLLPVGKYPMIHYALHKMKEAGIHEILVVTNAHSAGLYAAYIGSGSEWGVHVHFAIQDEAGGIAQALGLAEPFVGKGEKVVVLLGDNLFQESLTRYAADFEAQADGAMVLLAPVDDPRRFGVPHMENGRIVYIEEKPATPKSSYCVTGIYWYDSEVFHIVRRIRPSGRGELEITDVNNEYARMGKLSYGVLNGWWVDAGTHESLREAIQRMEQSGGDT